MVNFSGPGFVLAIIAMSYLAWIITTYVRTKHGYPIENEWGGMVEPKDSKTNQKLLAENAELKANVDRLEERLKVLERIATDPAKRLEDEIERLR
jgi:coenzyme F420-reducing hydrogenase alpha subunit